MKKLVSLALCLVIALAFAGCKKKTEEVPAAPATEAPAQAPMTSAQAPAAAPEAAAPAAK